VLLTASQVKNGAGFLQRAAVLPMVLLGAGEVVSAITGL
jgi:hypothetical protein